MLVNRFRVSFSFVRGGGGGGSRKRESENNLGRTLVDVQLGVLIESSMDNIVGDSFGCCERATANLLR